MAFETYRTLIAELASQQGYDAAVLAAQMWQESRFCIIRLQLFSKVL